MEKPKISQENQPFWLKDLGKRASKVRHFVTKRLGDRPAQWRSPTASKERVLSSPTPNDLKSTTLPSAEFAPEAPLHEQEVAEVAEESRSWNVKASVGSWLLPLPFQDAEDDYYKFMFGEYFDEVECVAAEDSDSDRASSKASQDQGSTLSGCETRADSKSSLGFGVEPDADNASDKVIYEDQAERCARVVGEMSVRCVFDFPVRVVSITEMEKSTTKEIEKSTTKETNQVACATPSLKVQERLSFASTAPGSDSEPLSPLVPHLELSMSDDSLDEETHEEDLTVLEVADNIHKKSEELLKSVSQALLDTNPSANLALLSRSKSQASITKSSMALTQSVLSSKGRNPFAPKTPAKTTGKKMAPEEERQEMESQVERLERRSHELMRLLSDAIQSDDDCTLKDIADCA
jgi:hypothetical protein